MRTKYLIGVIAVLLLILAIWLVPLALAAAGGSVGAPEPGSQTQSSPSGTQCPFLQTHPWLDPHGSNGGAGGTGGTGGTSSQVNYY